MSGVLRVALAAMLSLTVASNAMAQKVKSAKVKPFTAAEQLYFDRASNPLTNGGGGDGGGSGSGS
jgi:hypothetical protein